MGKLFKIIGNYFKGIKREWSKITWPTGKELAKYSFITIVFIIICALYFLGIDLIITYLRTGLS